jgi:PEP-CTERM motif
MKKILLIAGLAIAGLVSTYGQGTVNFANLGPGVNAPVNDINGTTRLGAGFLAQLYAGPDASSLAPVGTPTGFLAAAPGYFQGGVVTIATVAPGTVGTFRVHAWDSVGGTVNSFAAAQAAGAKYGSGNIFTVATGGAGTPPGAPSTLVGQTSFNLVPEPSTIALGVLGAAGLLMIRRRK